MISVQNNSLAEWTALGGVAFGLLLGWILGRYVFTSPEWWEKRKSRKDRSE